MEPWCRSNITPQCLEGLVRHGLLRPLTATEEWWLPGDEDKSSPPEGHVVSFAHFHERGFATPAHKFLRGLLHYYKVELQHLNPNGIQHIAVFVAVAPAFKDKTRYTLYVSPGSQISHIATNKGNINRQCLNT